MQLKRFSLLLTKKIKGKEYHLIIATKKAGNLYNAIEHFSAMYNMKFDAQGYHIKRIHPESTETYFITHIIPPWFPQTKK